MWKTYAIAPMFADKFQALEDRQEEFLAVDARDWDFDDGEDQEERREYEVVNGVAIYGIKGGMLAEGNLFTKIFGIATYDDIGSALAQMYTDPEVERVLISMSTPGGQVAGLSDLSESWRKLNAEKPVTVHTAGMLASAGVWLASNSSEIYASETADAGSIGVLINHVSKEKALKKAGVKVTTIKSAPLKSVGSPAKDLTAEEEAHIQKKVDESAELFKMQLYKTRHSITEAAFSGEMFSAKEAVDVGLVDGVKSYSDVFTDLMSAAAAEVETNNGIGGYIMKKKVTASMYESAVAAGADPNTLEVVSQEVYDAMVAEETAGAEEGADASEETSGADEGASASEETGAEDGVSASEEAMIEATAHQAVVDELAVAQARVAELETEVTALEAGAATVEALQGFAAERLGTMRVALGLQRVDMSEFSAEMIVNEYQAINKTFNKTFKIGGIVAPSAEEPKDVSPKITSIDKARRRAVGLG